MITTSNSSVKEERAAPYDLFAPLWPIARDAAELLASDRLEYVRACASKTCEWLFLDESKNHRRRWCDMTKCGNIRIDLFFFRSRNISQHARLCSE
jgi:predicted RNA-binding Zn ribbon-like protein